MADVSQQHVRHQMVTFAEKHGVKPAVVAMPPIFLDVLYNSMLYYDHPEGTMLYWIPFRCKKAKTAHHAFTISITMKEDYLVFQEMMARQDIKNKKTKGGLIHV